MRTVTHSRDETIAWGRRLGSLLRAGDVLTLSGPLGSGKTTLTKGLTEGLGLDDSRYVTSPTFVLVHEYPADVPVYHIDAYRLGGPEEADSLGLDEMFYGPGVTIIEWAERIAELLPAHVLRVVLDIEGEESRSLTLEPVGERYEAVVAAMG
ncbi:tRNA (adenosine(37)-N6)-threonylcarbamoyltransferase complex ATPase subunit type 1 TsaE [bacterium]|nr:tRNA (adenosine(37)-N6)-threonylcarbamoyltransferase complex ATPase subunit type 1 TsaE [bacterium]